MASAALPPETGWPDLGPRGTDPLVERTAALCEAVGTHLVPEAAGRLAAARDRLLEPLRIAVVGRVNAGKSTLVNALLGRRIAPTRASECTQVVTWYRFGAPDRAELVLRDGTRRPLPILDGFPAELGLDPGLVDRIEVHLQAAALRAHTLIDTPGLASLRSARDDATRRALLGEASSAEAVDLADAVLFLFRDNEKRDELDFLESYGEATGTLGAWAANAVGVLSQADVFGPGPWTGEDPIGLAAGLAARIEHDHAEHLCAVLPVAGLLAEAARTGAVTEADARCLADLADVEPIRLQLAEQLGLPAGVDPEHYRGVLERTGPLTVAQGRSLAAGGAASLQRWLIERSGIGALEEAILRVFTRRTRPLQAERVVQLADRLLQTDARDTAHRARGLELLEAARLDPLLHRLTELRALHRLPRQGPGVGPVREELLAVLDFDEPWRQLGADPDADAGALRALAGERRRQAQARITTARNPAVAHAARVLTRSYQLLDPKL